MGFLETVAKAKAYLQEHGRVSFRGLKREFELDDEALEDVLEELVNTRGPIAMNTFPGIP